MRWVFRLIGVVVVLALLAVGAVAMMPAERIAALALTRLETLTGRKVTLEGSVRPSLWPVLGVQTGPVTISNADWSSAGPMFRAEGLDISVDLAALIGGDVKITGFQADAPKLLLERAKDGRENWMFGGDGGGTVTTDTPGVGAAFTLAKGAINGGTVTFTDHRSGSSLELTDLDLTTAIPDYEGEVSLSLSANRNGQPFTLDATIGAFRTFLDGKVVPLKARLGAGKAKASFDGRAGWAPLAADGALDADLAGLAEIAALAGIAAPGLPEGLGRNKVAAKGKLTVTDAGTVHLRGGQVTLDSTALAVDADLTTAGERPKLTAKATAGALNLAALTGGAGGGAQGGAKAAGWPKDRMDVGALAALDADVALSAESADLGIAKFGAVQAKLTIDRARAVIDLRRVVAYGGTIAGQFVVNGRKGLSTGGDLTLAGMALQPMLQDFGGYDRLIGTGDLRVKFLASGNSVDALMHSVEGSGSVSLTKGELRGLDIAGMLRTLDTGFVGDGQKTIFDSIAGTFTMTGGNLKNDDLRLVSPFVTATGAGRVGLGARDQDYRIRATALADDQGQGGLSAPLKITGSWASPKFALDMQALADEKLAGQKAKLEEAAKAKLKDQLGIEQQEGESLEDAAKRKLNDAVSDEAQKALQRLLNGN